MEIGLFQLENLVHSRVQFCFLDVRETRSEVPAQLESLFAKAIVVAAKDAPAYLQKNLPGLEAPVILLSEDGKSAAKLGAALEAKGYANIYVIEGGVAGLALEL